MELSCFVTESGRITDQIHHVDVNAFAQKGITSSFILETPDAIAIFDTGTSDDVLAVLKYMRKNSLPLERVKAIVPTHYHFDHFGGGWRLWQRVHEVSHGVKVITTDPTRAQLQDTALHMERASKTFGASIGEMKPLPGEAYDIVEPGVPIPLPGLDSGQELVLVPTPGHTQDHVSPTLFRDGRAEFMFTGEAAGTHFQGHRFASLGTSMPGFEFNSYIDSLHQIISLDPAIAGYCHAGAIVGRENVRLALEENEQFSYFFRDFVRDAYIESGSARTVVERFIEEELPNRAEGTSKEWLARIIVALVYGQLVDLGLKPMK
jgi:glyoxylase-like metal-dependent hydrolase (beta-lactamase superfamily II)